MGSIVALAALPVAAQPAEPDTSWPGWPVFSGVALLAAASLWLLWRLDSIRPGSLRRADHPAPAPDAALPLALAALAVYLLPVVLLGVAIGLIGLTPGQDDTLRDQGTLVLISYSFGIAVAAAGCAIVVRAGLLPAREMRPRWRDAWVGCAAFTLAYPTLWVVSQSARAIAGALGGDTGSALQHGTLEVLTSSDTASPWWWAVLAGAIVGAPIVEEVVFRGLLQPALRAVLGPWSAVLIAGALFTLLHIPSGGGSSGATWLAIPTLAALAIALGIARERSGRLGVPIAMHMAFNAFNVALALLVTRG